MWSKKKINELIKQRKTSISEVLKKARSNPLGFEAKNKGVLLTKLNRELRELKKRL